MKALYLALKCFMLEFWDLKEYRPSWNRTANSYLSSLPMDAEAKCIHMQESTRICQLKVLSAAMMVQYPPPDEKRWSEPVLKLLQERLAMPHDIFAMNFGLWYNPDTARVSGCLGGWVGGLVGEWVCKWVAACGTARCLKELLLGSVWSVLVIAMCGECTTCATTASSLNYAGLMPGVHSLTWHVHAKAKTLRVTYVIIILLLMLCRVGLTLLLAH